MKFPHGLGVNLTGGAQLIVVLTGNLIVVGTLLGVINDRNYKKEEHCNDPNEFLLLQLTCEFSAFAPGSIVAVNIDNIAIISSGGDACFIG